MIRTGQEWSGLVRNDMETFRYCLTFLNWFKKSWLCIILRTFSQILCLFRLSSFLGLSYLLGSSSFWVLFYYIGLLQAWTHLFWRVVLIFTTAARSKAMAEKWRWLCVLLCLCVVTTNLLRLQTLPDVEIARLYMIASIDF